MGIYSVGPDFQARIKLLTKEEGGRNGLPKQGLRSDFIYEGESISYQYAIWPEFLDEDKNPIQIEKFLEVNECLANFYILDPILKDKVHKKRIQIGVKFNMMEGSKIIGLGTVTEIFM